MWGSAIGYIVTLTLSMCVALLAAEAQPARTMPRIGVIMPGVPPGAAGDELDGFRQGLRDLGYVEGHTITLEVRWGEEQRERYPAVVYGYVTDNAGVGECGTMGLFHPRGRGPSSWYRTRWCTNSSWWLSSSSASSSMSGCPISHARCPSRHSNPPSADAHAPECICSHDTGHMWEVSSPHLLQNL